MRRKLITGLAGLLLIGAAVVPSSFAADQMGYDHGFFVRSADDNFMAKINSFFSFNYQHQNNDGPSNTSGFNTTQARPSIMGNAYSPDWTYKISAELASGAFVMLDYYINWRHCDAFNVRFGQFKVPYSREGLADLGHLTTISRSLNNAFLGGGELFEPGVGFWGVLADKMFEYYLTASNGNGVNGSQPADDIDMRWAARFVVNMMGNHRNWYGDIGNSSEPHANIGVGVNWNRLDNDTDGAYDDNLAFTADGAFAYVGFDVNVAYYMGRIDLAAGGDSTNSGFDAVISYFIMPETAEIGAHLAWFEPDVGAQVIQGGPVFNWFLRGRDARLQLQYDYTQVDAAGDPVSHMFTAQAQFGF